MKPWRERLKAAQPATFTPDVAARLDREDQVHFAAIAVFGNETDAGKWVYGSTADFGGWQTPGTVAANSDAGLVLVMAKLDAMRSTVTPKADPLPLPPRGRPRVFKARR